MTKSADRKLFCGNFPELQGKFVADVIVQRHSGPLAPLDVVVTGQLQRLYLKRELARQGCSHANVRFKTLAEAARDLAQPALESNPIRMVPDTLRGLLMTRAIVRAGELRYFGQISQKNGFRTAAWTTINELRSAGLTADELKWSAERMTGSLRQTLQNKLQDLAAIWMSLSALMREQKWADHIQLMSMACESSRAPESETVLFYGFDALSEVERRVIEQLSRGRTCGAYIPYRTVKASLWTRPVYEAFISLNYQPQMLEPLSKGNSLLHRIQSGLFEALTTLPAGDEADDSLSIVSAPGRVREVEEMTREILYSPLGEVNIPSSVAVLLRTADTYHELLQEDFSRAGITGYFHTNRTLAQTSSGRACRLLAGLTDGNYPRADVMEFLLTSPVKWPASFTGSPGAVPAAEWNQFSLLAGIYKERNHWIRALHLLEQQWKDERERFDEDDEDGDAERESRLQSLRSLRYFAVHGANCIRRIRTAETWQRRVELFWIFFCDMIAKDSHFDSIHSELANAAERDQLHDELTDEAFCSFIDEALARPISRDGRFQVHEPTVATSQQAIGLLFDEVILPGLAEREVPRAVSQDPLLLDEEREWLQLAIESGKQIPLRNREREREVFLFYQAVHSAKRRLVVMYPRKDSSTARDQLPSTFLLKLVEAATRRPADFNAVEHFITESAQGNFLLLNRLREAAPARASSDLQYDEACLGKALETKSLRPVAYLWNQNSLFLRGVEAEQRRFHEKIFTEFDGVIHDPALHEWIAKAKVELTSKDMAGYIQCPFRYFVNLLLEIFAIDEPPDIQRVNPAGRGMLVHRILKDFYQTEHNAGRLPLEKDAIGRLAAYARDYFKHYERDHLTGLPLLWQLEQETMLKAMSMAIEQDIDHSTRFVPRYFEELMDYTSPEGGFGYHGRIDRIDIDPEGHARVIDYSTAKSQSQSYRTAKDFGLPLQRLAAEKRFGLSVESATLLSMADEKLSLTELSKAEWDLEKETFLNIAAVIREGIRQGKFYPYPEDSKCGHCSARAACGSGRFTLKWQDDPDQTRDFRAIVEEMQS